jgi:uncharacterized protein (DUF433 family)
MNVMLSNLVTISPEIQSGAPVFAGTRVPVKNLFDYLKGGDTIDEFLKDFPSVKPEQVTALLSLFEGFLAFNPSAHEENIAG